MGEGGWPPFNSDLYLPQFFSFYNNKYFSIYNIFVWQNSLQIKKNILKLSYMDKLKLLQNFRKINCSPQKPFFPYFYFEFLKFLHNFKADFPLTVIIKYWLHFPCCTVPPWAYLTPNSLFLPPSHFFVVPPPQWKKNESVSHVWPFATPWTVAHQVPLSMGFPKKEYWSG